MTLRRLIREYRRRTEIPHSLWLPRSDAATMKHVLHYRVLTVTGTGSDGLQSIPVPLPHSQDRLLDLFRRNGLSGSGSGKLVA